MVAIETVSIYHKPNPLRDYLHVGPAGRFLLSSLLLFVVSEIVQASLTLHLFPRYCFLQCFHGRKFTMFDYFLRANIVYVTLSIFPLHLVIIFVFLTNTVAIITDRQTSCREKIDNDSYDDNKTSYEYLSAVVIIRRLA